MIKGTVTSLALVVTLVGIPVLASAQGAAAQPPRQKPAEKMTGEKPAQPPADKPGQPNFGTLISSINNLPREMSELEARKSLTASDVQIVHVADLAEGNNAAALDNALSRNSANVAKLNAALSANKILSAYLNTNKIAPTRVVAIDVPTTGPVTLFVQPAAVR